MNDLRSLSWTNTDRAEAANALKHTDDAVYTSMVQKNSMEVDFIFLGLLTNTATAQSMVVFVTSNNSISAKKYKRLPLSSNKKGIIIT